MADDSEKAFGTTLHEFRNALSAAHDQLMVVSDEAASFRPAPGQWSIKEIIGHLVDSASNNHQRFLRARFQNDLVFPPYAQDDWVRAQHYQEAAWQDLLELWYTFNLHLSRVMALTPQDIRERPTTVHNFDRIAWQTVKAGTPSTLDYFMKDYIGHWQHHMNQIDAILERKAPRP